MHRMQNIIVVSKLLDNHLLVRPLTGPPKLGHPDQRERERERESIKVLEALGAYGALLTMD